MLDRFIFENHLGQRFDGLANGVYLNSSELRDYAWNYEAINNRISRFYRSIRSRKIPLIVKCNSLQNATQVKNKLLELAEADVYALLPGKVYINGYYTTGYITASTKKDYLINPQYCRIELTLTSAEPAWYTEKTHVFSTKADSTSIIGAGADYPYDYPYDYAVFIKNKQIVCDSVVSNKFKIRIYGEATDPTITIADHQYMVNGMIKAGESLLIDGLNKTITLTTAQGNQINWFNKRNRASYIFEPIQPGINDVRYNGSFNFDLTIVEERSEPKWI
jgi:hypothetical protein